MSKCDPESCTNNRARKGSAVLGQDATIALILLDESSPIHPPVPFYGACSSAFGMEILPKPVDGLNPGASTSRLARSLDDEQRLIINSSPVNPFIGTATLPTHRPIIEPINPEHEDSTTRWTADQVAPPITKCFDSQRFDDCTRPNFDLATHPSDFDNTTWNWGEGIFSPDEPTHWSWAEPGRCTYLPSAPEGSFIPELPTAENSDQAINDPSLRLRDGIFVNDSPNTTSLVHEPNGVSDNHAASSCPPQSLVFSRGDTPNQLHEPTPEHPSYSFLRDEEECESIPSYYGSPILQNTQMACQIAGNHFSFSTTSSTAHPSNFDLDDLTSTLQGFSLDS